MTACQYYKSCKWFTLEVVAKKDHCENYFIDIKEKPFCGHFPFDFTGNFPPKEVIEFYDPKTYTRARTLPKSDIIVIKRTLEKEPESTPEPQVRKRKPRVKKETPTEPPPEAKKIPVEVKIVVDESPKIVKNTNTAKTSVVYDIDETDW